MQIIRRGDAGDAVRDLQHRLTELGHHIRTAELEGVFGPSTEKAVRAFQLARSLPTDGAVGPDTWGQLVEAGYLLGDRTLYLRSPAFRGDDVRSLQRMLNALGFDAGKEDGILGRRTSDAVMDFQRNLGDRPDGIVGLDTVRALERMRPAMGGPGFAVLREEETVRSMVASLAGSVIAIDASFEADEPVEADLTLALAGDLEQELRARGAQPVLLRGRDDAEPSERANVANAVAGVLCISFALTSTRREEPGASCAYWGTSTTHSPAGRRLAELVHTQLVALGLPDAGIRPLGIALLRETRMPAVQVEPGQPGSGIEARLADPTFRAAIARAVADGIARFFAGGA